MTWISKTITAFGSLLLAHACYSAQEHSALQTLKSATSSLTSSPASSSSSSSSTTGQSGSPATATASLPIDIAIETVIATIIVLLGLVLNTKPLRPIQWRVWAGKIEREGEEGFVDNEGEVIQSYIGNPFRVFETRPGFVDIRRQRREFADWVKGGGSSSGGGQ